MSAHERLAQAGDPLEAVQAAVAWLEADQDALVDGCTDPQATDLAQLLLELQETTKKLQTITRDLEVTTAKRMLDDELEAPGLVAERRRGTDRKSWDHAGWQHDVRAKALQASGLRGAQLVTAEGELVPAAEALQELLAKVQAAHGSTGPKVTALRSFGLDVRDYCESSPGAWSVKVHRRAVEGDDEVEAS